MSLSSKTSTNSHNLQIKHQNKVSLESDLVLILTAGLLLVRLTWLELPAVFVTTVPSVLSSSQSRATSSVLTVAVLQPNISRPAW